MHTRREGYDAKAKKRESKIGIFVIEVREKSMDKSSSSFQEDTEDEEEGEKNAKKKRKKRKMEGKEGTK